MSTYTRVSFFDSKSRKWYPAKDYQKECVLDYIKSDSYVKAEKKLYSPLVSCNFYLQKWTAHLSDDCYIMLIREDESTDLFNVHVSENPKEFYSNLRSDLRLIIRSDGLYYQSNDGKLTYSVGFINRLIDK